LEELQSLPSEQRQYQYIQGSVPMPVSLINRLTKNEIFTHSTELFNFIIRTHYKPLYEKCFDTRNGVIGTPGIAKSVSRLYPLLNHHLKWKNSLDSPPVLLHSIERDDLFLFFDGSCWKIPEFMSETQFTLRNCLRDYPGLVYLVDDPIGSKSHIGSSLMGDGSKSLHHLQEKRIITNSSNKD
jgi:hypothetical protein